MYSLTNSWTNSVEAKPLTPMLSCYRQAFPQRQLPRRVSSTCHTHTQNPAAEKGALVLCFSLGDKKPHLGGSQEASPWSLWMWLGCVLPEEGDSQSRGPCHCFAVAAALSPPTLAAEQVTVSPGLHGDLVSDACEVGCAFNLENVLNYVEISWGFRCVDISFYTAFGDNRMPLAIPGHTASTLLEGTIKKWGSPRAVFRCLVCFRSVVAHWKGAATWFYEQTTCDFS